MIYYHGQISPNLTLDYIGTGNNRYGVGLYFTSIKENALLYGDYVYSVDSNDYRLLDGDNITFTQSYIQKALNFLKMNNEEEYYYLISDWDENNSKAIEKIINAILDSNDNLEITQSIWYLILYNLKNYKELNIESKLKNIKILIKKS